MRQITLEIVIFCKHEVSFPVLSDSQRLYYEDAMYCSLRNSISKVSAVIAFAEEDTLVGSIQYFADMSNRAYVKSDYTEEIKSEVCLWICVEGLCQLHKSSVRLGNREVPSRETLGRVIVL